MVDYVTRQLRQARRIAHKLQHPASTAEEAFLRQLPPSLRQVYRDLRHPPSPEQLLRRHINRLTARAKSHIKSEVKRALKGALSPRPGIRPQPQTDTLPTASEDRVITVPAPHAEEGEVTVTIQGMPSLQFSKAIDLKIETPISTMTSPGFLQECDATIMAMIGESVVEMEELFDEEIDEIA